MISEGWRSPSIALVLVIACLLCLIGCSQTQQSGSVSDDGPLEATSGKSGKLCVPDFSANAGFSHGVEVLKNDSGLPIDITKVSLVNAAGFRVVDSYQRQLGRGPAAGDFPVWPPDEFDSLKPLASVSADIQFNLVLHLRTENLDADEASFSAVRLDYEQDGKQFTEVTPYGVTWRARCA